MIDDSDARDATTRGCVAADLAPTRRELDGVVEEISDDRLDPSGVNIHEHRATRQANVEAVTAGDLRLNRRGRGSDDGAQALRLTFETGDALLEARGLEHLIDELIHVVELAFDDGHRALERVRVQRFVGHHREVPAHHPNRPPQLVRRQLQEVRAHLLHRPCTLDVLVQALCFGVPE